MNDLPAILGGWPIRANGPPDGALIDADVSAAMHAALADGSWSLYHGPHLPRLESALAERFGVAHAIPCASGTLAVEIALRAAGVAAGDEVVMGAYDYEPSFLTVHAIGAVPVLVDVESDRCSIQPGLIESAITAKTKAILATHLHGGMVDMGAVNAIASKHGVSVVEDAVQICGATVQGRPAGSIGDFGVLSFGGSKLLTAGRGGAILTNRDDLAQRARVLLGRGNQQWGVLSELQAAVLLPQLAKLSERTEHRQRMVGFLLEQICGVPGLKPFAIGEQSAFYKLGFYFDEAEFGISRERFVAAIRAEGIAFDVGFRALHVGRAPSRYRAAGPLPNAERAGKTVVVLHHPVLSLGEAEIEQVATAVWKTYRNASRLK